MIRVILDANIVVSALLKPHGLQSIILQKGLAGSFQIILSEKIFLEICRVLQYEKIAKRMPFTLRQIKKILERITDSASWIADEIEVKLCEDPDDDIYLACAKESQADYLVSGDQHLLKLKKMDSTAIVTTRWFLDFISAATN